uniref:S-layer protein domain-containing protein n=1 Tax=Methanococcoides sp. TaxID=1966350 RepID=UPI00272DDE41
MKSFIAILMAALMVLSFVSVASAADTVEIRSPVFNGSDLDNLDRYSTDFTDFAGFFFDLDDGIGSENISINAALAADRTIDDDGLVYVTDIQSVDYTYEGWADSPTDNQFDKMGFLAVEYVPVNGDPAILSKLILDDDEKYTMRVGETLDLGEGFALTPKQIDVDGDKVWLELTKDGKFLDDDVYDATAASNPANKSWDYEADDIAGEDDVVVLRVHVNEVFQ